MSSSTQAIPPMTPEAYLDWEPHQEERYEYVDGQIIAMTGGSVPHNDITLNLYTALRPHLKPQGCRVNVADVKVQAQAHSRYFYPDVVISCHPEDQQATTWISHPTVLVEVLSPSTSKYDQTQKLQYYRQIPSLQEYLLIASDQIAVELYQRQAATNKFWTYSFYGPGESFAIPSIDFEWAVDLIYQDITL